MSAEDTTVPVALRLSVGFTPDATEALEQLRALTGWTKADVINRAVVAYSYLEHEMRNGQKLLLRDSDGEAEIRFL